MNQIFSLFDKLEDKIRGTLSHYPVFYALIAGTAIVIFWRGIWGLADEINLSNTWSLVASIVIMLSSGLFVSFFIGDNIILAGIRREKKLIEKTEDEILLEVSSLTDLRKELKAVHKELREIKKKLG